MPAIGSEEAHHDIRLFARRGRVARVAYLSRVRPAAAGTLLKGSLS